MADEKQNKSWLVGLGAALLAVTTLAVIAALVWQFVIRARLLPPPPQQCVAQVGENHVPLTREQSENAAIIVAESIRRGLVPRAATIALATAYQESGLRNLDYGDRDSLGLFQQRPSQGWGTEEQIMDPWYSAGRFYEELVKFKGWETGDITTYAQKVQRSGFPEAYRKHEGNARTVASALRGETPASFSCLEHEQQVSTTGPVTELLERGLGEVATISTSDGVVTIESNDPDVIWAGVQLAMATTRKASISAASVGNRTWQHDSKQLAAWQGDADPAPTSGTVTVFGADKPNPKPS